MGGSYGGYCALAAVTYTPEVFACSVDIVGPSNLKTLLSLTSFWLN
jgi:dipeptidyl aminopeptidase/acylaminoacyl peptidase